MRKNKSVKIVVFIIILCIIGILICLGIIFFHYSKNVNVSASAVDETKELASNESVGNNGDINNQIEENLLTENNITENEEQINNEEFIDKINNIYNGTEGKRVFLTFDDGPTTQVTPYILDILDKYNIKATFFVLGNRVKSNPEIVKREYDSGHYIANHSYSHKYKKIYKSEDNLLNEYNKTEDAIREAIGDQSYSSNLFRFPGGSKGGPYEEIKSKARKKLNENGIAYLDWSALTYDADGADSKKEILNNLKETMKGWDNVVVLMHDAPDKQITYQTLEDVIKYLQEEGYKFENIYDLMEE